MFCILYQLRCGYVRVCSVKIVTFFNQTSEGNFDGVYCLRQVTSPGALESTCVQVISICSCPMEK